jgi:hypothetical protein
MAHLRARFPYASPHPSAVLGDFQIRAHPIYGSVELSVLEGSADYLWRPSLANPSPSSEAEFGAARKNWSQLLSRFDPDARRQLAWRGLHGLFGGEYYDARWAPGYRALDMSLRVASPFLIALAIGVLFGRPFTGPDRALNVLAPLLVVALIGQGFLVGALPRYVLPVLPVLLAIGVLGVFGIRKGSPRQMVPAFVAVLAILLTIAAVPGIVDWEWGKVEAAGVRLVQKIPRGALPATGPATLHIRIAAARIPTSTEVAVLGPDERPLYTTAGQAREQPALTIPLPDWLLALNRKTSVEISLVSSGRFETDDFLLFPVVPTPWGSGCWRAGKTWLSPYTGIRQGSLDWWGHRGAP